MSVHSIEEVTEVRMNRWADKFTTLYITHGEIAAGKYLTDNVPEEYHAKLQPFVESQFSVKGYDLS